MGTYHLLVTEETKYIYEVTAESPEAAYEKWATAEYNKKIDLQNPSVTVTDIKRIADASSSWVSDQEAILSDQWEITQSNQTTSYRLYLDPQSDDVCEILVEYWRDFWTLSINNAELKTWNDTVSWDQMRRHIAKYWELLYEAYERGWNHADLNHRLDEIAEFEKES